MQNMSKYRCCEICSHKFKLPITVRKVELVNNKLEIFCPRCNSNHTYLISKEIYEQKEVII